MADEGLDLGNLFENSNWYYYLIAIIALIIFILVELFLFIFLSFFPLNSSDFINKV